MTPAPADLDFVDLVGDGQLLFTAPFFPDVDPLDFRPGLVLPDGRNLDSAGLLRTCERPVQRFVKGSLTFGVPAAAVLTHFEGSPQLRDAIADEVERIVRMPVEVTVCGALFDDGYGTVAIRMTVAQAWEPERRHSFMTGFGRRRRDDVADALRELLLPPLTELTARCCAAPSATSLPYFNLTYVASTTNIRAGRALLPDDLRELIYPRSPDFIASDSPWSDEFYYAGYAFSLLASPDPAATLDELEFLLLHLDVLFARMDRSSAAADKMIRAAPISENVDWLVDLERRLRADYEALVGPTFSYDYHILKLRDAVLFAWETDKIHDRTDLLLQMARESVERRLAQDQARRVSRLNAGLAFVALFSFVSSIESVVDLLKMLF